MFPPEFEGETLPLIINLHGGGDDRRSLAGSKPMYEDLMISGDLPRAVVASFSAGLSFYTGGYEVFIVDEYPAFLNSEFGVSLRPEDTAITGVSMGGFGSLKVALKHPERFGTVAALGARCATSHNLSEELSADNWWSKGAIEKARGASPWTKSSGRQITPQTLLWRMRREFVSGISIYLEWRRRSAESALGNGILASDSLGPANSARVSSREVGRPSWACIPERLLDAHSFLAKGLTGGRLASRDIVLTDAEAGYAADFVNGVEPDDSAAQCMSPLSDRAPAVLQAMFAPGLSSADELIAASPKFKRFE